MPRRLLNFPSFFFVLALIASLATSPPSLAQGLAEGGFDPADIEAMTKSTSQVPLTKDKVDRLIVSFTEMKTGAEFPDTELPESAPTPSAGISDLDAMAPDKRAALEATAQAPMTSYRFDLPATAVSRSIAVSRKG